MPAEIRIVISESRSGSGLKDAANDVRALGNTARESSGGFNAFREVAVGALRQVGVIALETGIQAAQAMGQFAADSITAAGNFEASVNGLAAVAGDALGKAGFSLDDVSAKALQLGKDTQFSAQEAIQAMTELAKGGVPIQSVMTDATDATLALAAAASVDLTNAAEIVAKQLGVWSETGVTAAEVTDLLAGAANASTVGVEDLALGLANAGGTAKTAGVPFNELVQTMALIAPNFSSASDAGTSLKTFLSRLIPTTNDATAAMIDLGLATEDGKSKFFDAQGEFIGMEKAAALLQEATAGLSEEQKLLAFNTIFGQDAIRTAAALANEGAEGYNAMGQAIVDSGGAAAAAATKQEGYNFALETFKGSVETAQIILGTAFLPVLTEVITKGTEIVNTFAGVIERFGNLVPAIMASETPFTTFLHSLAIAVPGLGAVIFPLLGFIKALQESQNPLLTLGEAIANLAQQALPGLMSGLASLAANLVGWIAAQIPMVRTALVTWAGAFGQWVLDALPGLGANLASLYQTVLTWLGSQLPGIVAMLAIWGQRFSDWVVQALPLLITELGNLVANMLGWIAANAPAILAQLATWAAQFITWAATTAAELIVAMGELFAQFITWLIGKAPEILSTLAQWGKAFEDWIPGAISGLVTGLGALWDRLKGWMAEKASALSADGSIGKALVDGIKAGINAALSGLIAAATAAVRAAISAAKSAGIIQSPSKAMADEVGLPLSQGIAQGLAAGAPMVAASAAGVTTAAISGAQRVVNKSTTNNFNLSVTSASKATSLISDFGIMKTMAGVR